MSRWRSRSVVAICACLVATAAPASTLAQGVERECRFDERTRTLRCTVMLTPTPPLIVELDPGVPGMRIPLRWIRTAERAFSGQAPGVLDWTCPPLETGTETLYGIPYRTELVNTASGDVVSVEFECVYPGEDPPEPPPPPPTLGEFIDAASLVLVVEAKVNPNPAWGGITGLETWLWCDDPGDVEVTVTLRGWTAEATMGPVQYHWDVNGPSGASFHPMECGTEERPGARWVPETMGAHEIVLAATWAGSWTLTFGDTLTGTFVLGPVDVPAAPSPYPVGEHVGVLTNGVGS